MEQYCFSGDIAGSPVKAAKDGARELLDSRENRLLLILAFLLFMMMTISVGTLTAVLWMPLLPLFEGFSWYDNLYEISLVIDYILMLLFTLPAALGALRMVHQMCRGERVGLTDVFYAYRHLPHTWAVTLILSLPALIIAGIWLVTPALLTYLKGAGVEPPAELVLRVCVIVAAALLSVGALVLALRTFFFPGLAMRGDMGIRQALMASFSASRGRMREIIRFVFSFSGWAALSLVTFGVFFLIQLAPHYTVSYMLYCDRATNDCDKEASLT